jgi:hypothetical protein
MLSITIPKLHNLKQFGRRILSLSASDFVAADAAGAAISFAAIGADAFAVVDGFATVVASRLCRSDFLLQESSPITLTMCKNKRIKVSETPHS